MKTYCEKCGKAEGLQPYSATPASGVQASTFAEKFPDLQKFLEVPRNVAQGVATGAITVFFEAGVYKCCLNDRPERRSSFVSHTSLGECFRIADLQLRTGRSKWRHKGYKPQIARPLF